MELQVHAVEELLKEKSVHMSAVQRELQSLQVKSQHALQATTQLQARTRNKSSQQVPNLTDYILSKMST